MSKYFSYFPDVYVRSSSYRNNNVDPHVLAKNLFRRIKIRENLDDIILGFSQYTIRNNQRPDGVAFDFYGNSGYDWIVLIVNNIINLYSEWPMTEDELYKMCEEAYAQFKKGTIYPQVVMSCSIDMNKTLMQKMGGLN